MFSFQPLFLLVCLSFLLNCECFLYIRASNFWLVCHLFVTNIFSRFVACLFTYVYLNKQHLMFLSFNVSTTFNVVEYIHLFLCNLYFWCLKKSFATLRSWDWSFSYLAFWAFMVLFFKTLSFVYLELIFCIFWGRIWLFFCRCKRLSLSQDTYR